MAAIDNLLCRYQPVHKNRPTNEVFPVKASFAVKIWVIIYTYICVCLINRKWQDYVYIQCEYKSTKQKIKHLLREENKVKVYIRISKMTIFHYVKLLEVLMKNRVAKNG